MTELTDFWISPHPRYPDVLYPVDYGYLEGTRAGDGDGIDIFHGRGGGDVITGICCTIDSLKRDAEVKILYACTDEDIAAIRQLLSDGPMACLVVMHPSAIHQPDTGGH
jgi:inorganic pyrophosphatase